MGGGALMDQTECQEACRVLNIDDIDPHNLDVNHANDIIQVFFDILEEVEDPDEKFNISLIKAKNQLLYEIIKNKSNCNNVFEFDLDFSNSMNKCKYCGGGGIKPVVEQGIVKNMDKCPDCLGSGIQHKPCRECHETGWIGPNHCSICNGRKRIPFRKNAKKKCSRCGGNKYIDRKVSTGRILSHITCTVCKGYGVIGWEKACSPKT